MHDLQSMLSAGVKFHQEGDLSAAIKRYSEALERYPSDFNALQLTATALSQSGRHSEAVALFEKALNVNAQNPVVWTNCGLALQNLGEFQEALECHNRALALDSNNCLALVNQAACHQGLGNLQQAEEFYLAALKITPHLTHAHRQLATIYTQRSQHNHALSHYENIIQLEPSNLDALFGKASALYQEGHLQLARQGFEKLLAIHPLTPSALLNHGVVLEDLGFLERSLESVSKAIEIDSDYADARYNRGRVLLKMGKLQDGFSDYYSRWSADTIDIPHLKTQVPMLGRNGRTEHLLIWGEQGIGDEILFSKTLPLAKRLASRVTVALDGRLRDLYREAFPSLQFVSRSRIRDETAHTNIDAHVAIGDVAYCARATDLEIAELPTPFLKADHVRKQQVQRLYRFKVGVPILGISWRSASREYGTANSVALEAFASILEGTEAQLVNLQYGATESEIKELEQRAGKKIFDSAELDIFNDIDGLAALITHCDLVLTIGNINAHLAGALGCSGLVLSAMGSVSPWYWGAPENKQAWYPSLDIVYQDAECGWDRAVADAGGWLRKNILATKYSR